MQNFDETGLQRSTSGHKKSILIIVAQNYPQDLVFKTSLHISTLIEIDPSIAMLEPYILIPRELEHPNVSSCLYYSMLKVYWSTKTFITRSIFNNYFANAVIRYLGNARAKYQNANFEAIIIYPHLKGHISPNIFAHCAEHNIHIVVLQLHSLHLLQPSI